MPSAENCTACRFHQEIDQGAQNALAFCPLKTRNTAQSKRLPLVDSLFIISDSFLFVNNFFKTFFEVLKQIFQKSNFSDRRLFRNSLFSISNSKPFVKNFFLSFQIFSVRPPCLSATALIEYHRDYLPVNNFFHFSAIFFFVRLITNAATERPTLTADRAHATTSSTTLEFFFFLRGFFIIISPFILTKLYYKEILFLLQGIN